MSAFPASFETFCGGGDIFRLITKQKGYSTFFFPMTTRVQKLEAQSQIQAKSGHFDPRSDVILAVGEGPFLSIAIKIFHYFLLSIRSIIGRMYFSAHSRPFCTSCVLSLSLPSFCVPCIKLQAESPSPHHKFILLAISHGLLKYPRISEKFES